MRIFSFIAFGNNTIPPVLSFHLLVLCDGRGKGVRWVGDRNRQVFRCVMFDMLTQHAFITGRRHV